MAKAKKENQSVDEKKDAQEGKKMDTLVKEHETKTIKLKAEKKQGCVVSFSIVVPKEKVEKDYQQAIKAVNKEISIPGFRKGKAPSGLIEKNYPAQVKDEWNDLVLNGAFQEALSLTGFTPFSKKSIKPPRIDKISKEDGAIFTLSFEANPDIPEIDPANIQLKKIEPKPVTEKQIEKAIENLQFEQASWSEIKDRSVQEDDYVDVDIDSLESPSHSLAKNTRFFVKKGTMADWIYKLVIDQVIGNSVEGVSEQEPLEEGEEREEAFTPTKVKITIKKIWEGKFPEMNEEFLKKFGCQTVDELKQKVKESLEKNAEKETQTRMVREMENQILDLYPFDIPETLLENERMQKIQQENSRLQKASYSKEDIKNMQESISQRMKKEADEELRLLFLFQKLAHEKKISISQEELMNELNRQLFFIPQNEKVIDSSMPPEEIRRRLEVIVSHQKAKDYLMEKVNFFS